MNTLDLVIYCVPLLGVTISILYYAMVLRNSNRTRSAQLFMSLHSIMSDMEGMSAYLDTMYMEWEDYADFERKYGSDTNPKAYPQEGHGLELVQQLRGAAEEGSYRPRDDI